MRGPLQWACVATVVSVANVAYAEPPVHSGRVEGALAIPVLSPHAQRFDVGGGLALAYELRPISWLGIELRGSAYWLPSSGSFPTQEGFGTYYAPALGARVYPLVDLGVGDLWIGASGALVITGGEVRPGVEIGLGYEFDIESAVRLGPFIRYHHTFQTDQIRPDAFDAGFLSIGLSVAFPGLPARPRDSDFDGHLDSVDQCPAEPEDDDGFQDDDGCPEADNDGDGIPDLEDRCPREAEDMDGQQDEDGCAEADGDLDADGITDAVDACPTAPEDRDGHEDADGCPDLDNDGDGIPDAGDRCPNEPEAMNGYEDDDGCPDVAQAADSAHLEHLGQRILFPRERAYVEGNSRPVLRQVARFLTEHPEIRRVRVEAHASAEGSSEYNMDLSRRRAERVIHLLVEDGVAAERLMPEPLGDRAPEFTGDNEEDHARNRRVIFVIVERAP